MEVYIKWFTHLQETTTKITWEIQNNFNRQKNHIFSALILKTIKEMTPEIGSFLNLTNLKLGLHLKTP